MIRIKMTTTKGELREMAVAAISDMREKAINVLNRVGEEAVNLARSSAKLGRDWRDDTGNLRSSIGYVVCENGQPVRQSGFNAVLPTAKEGPKTGLDYALRIGGETKGLALVVVAGMEYAVYVADKGYDVLSSSQILARMRVPQLLNGLAQYEQENR